MRLLEVQGEEPSSVFVTRAEQWLAHAKLAQSGISTPSISVLGSRVVVLEAIKFAAGSGRRAAMVLVHLGKMADLLQVTIKIEGARRPEVYGALGYRLVNGELVRAPALREEMQPFAQMRRWWVNTADGEIIAVPEDSSHDSYMRDNQTQFGIDKHQKWSEADKLAKLAGQKRWQPASYDSQLRQLTIAFNGGTQKALRWVIQHLKDQLPAVSSVIVQVGNKSRDMAGDQLGHFLRNGRLPAK